MTAALPTEMTGTAPVARGASRAISISLIVHVGAVVFFVLAPRDWLFEAKKSVPTMMVSLSGPLGPKTGGMVALGGQPVEKVAEPKKNEPIPVAASKPAPSVATVTPKTTPKPEPTPDTKAPPAPSPKPVTGREVTQGTARANTPAKGEGIGIAQGGGSGSNEPMIVVPDFCCQEYLDGIASRIQRNWESKQPEPGETVVSFVVKKDGTITDIKLDKTGTSGLLDRYTIGHMRSIGKVLPLPPQFLGESITIHLKFIYKAP